MPNPLRSDRTAALGALMVIAGAHAELLDWVARMVCDAPPAARASTNAQPEASTNSQPQPKSREPRGAKSPAVRKPNSNGTDPHLALRREARDRDDGSLRQAMRDAPQAPIGDWAKAIGKSRTSVAALHSLRDAGMADSIEGKWSLVEPDAPGAAAPRWVAPLSAASHAHASP